METVFQYFPNSYAKQQFNLRADYYTSKYDEELREFIELIIGAEAANKLIFFSFFGIRKHDLTMDIKGSEESIGTVTKADLRDAEQLTQLVTSVLYGARPDFMKR